MNRANRNAKLIRIGKTLIINIFRFSLIIALAFMILYPLLRMINIAITYPRALNMVGSVWVPTAISSDNIRTAWAILNFVPYFTYTIRVVGAMMLLQMANAAFAGYAFARLRFRGMGILFVFVLITFIIPMEVFRLPRHIMFVNFDIFGIVTAVRGSPLNLIGEPTVMYIMTGLGMGIAGGLFVYIFRQFFRGLPKELEEAAYVDGAGFIRTFFTIVLPMAKPAFLTVGTLSFIWNYNDTTLSSLFDTMGQYLLARINTLAQTVGGTTMIQQQIGIATRTGRLSHDVVTVDNVIYDAAIFSTTTLLSILPLILLFLIIQKQFVQGVERSGIVG